MGGENGVRLLRGVRSAELSSARLGARSLHIAERVDCGFRWKTVVRVGGPGQRSRGHIFDVQPPGYHTGQDTRNWRV